MKLKPKKFIGKKDSLKMNETLKKNPYKTSLKYFLIIALILFSSPIFSQNFFSKNYSVLTYGGIFVNSDLAPISFNLDFKYKPSYLWAVGVNRRVNKKFSILEFEMETLLGRHTGYMNHWEAVVLGIARVNNVLKLPVSLAIGEGQSFSSQNPKMENLRKGYDRGKFNLDDIESRAWLNYLMFEIDYSFRNVEHEPKIFVRLHHRSGIYGVYCSPHPPCGSNYVVYGAKLSF